MYLTGGFHWFHRSFGKVHSSDCMQELPLRLLTFWVTDPSAVLTKLLSFFPSGWEIPPSYPRVLSFFHPTIYIPFSSSEETHVTFSEALFSPTSGSAESKQLITLQHVTLWRTRVLSAYKELQMEHSSLCSPKKRNERSFYAHHCFIPSHCAPSATIPCFLKPGWRKWEREHFLCPRSGLNLLEGKETA